VVIFPLGIPRELLIGRKFNFYFSLDYFQFLGPGRKLFIGSLEDFPGPPVKRLPTLKTALLIVPIIGYTCGLLLPITFSEGCP